MKLMSVQPADLAQYKLDMQEAFQMDAVEGGFSGEEEILPEDHIDRSLNTPGAIACRSYAFSVLGGSIIRDTNIPSQNVARRNGMTVADTWTKHCRGVDMPHLKYVVNR